MQLTPSMTKSAPGSIIIYMDSNVRTCFINQGGDLYNNIELLMSV
jgi:hypothetical protein